MVQCLMFLFFWGNLKLIRVLYVACDVFCHGPEKLEKKAIDHIWCWESNKDAS